MFDTVLVANRGEVACRVLRTLRRLGVRSVAVHSDADVHALHVRQADEVVRLGPGPTAESYLRGDRVIEAALDRGAQAIHPGYGLLSENADFAAACEQAGLAFVGPTPEQLRRFGSKHQARSLAQALGVPLLAGTGLLADLDEARDAARAVGYPVLLKSTGGGGGIGMRRCDDEAELASAFDPVRRLAIAHFGDGGVFLEHFVAAARHVEVQVLGDGRGRVHDLGTRDCSLQRRNQKVLEEAPAPGLPEDTVAALVTSAVRLAEAVDYRSVGTVEFLVDTSRGVPSPDDVSFLEVNTRLQVEHPVTEAVYRVDLVEAMLQVASGDPIEILDRPPTAGGHALEVRLYAEDPGHDFRPSTGTVTAWRAPAAARTDGWVEAGTEVSPHYDPLLAKLITTGESRPAALATMARALADTKIAGVATNLAWLRRVVDDPDLAAARHTTATLAGISHRAPAMEVERAGTFTTVQDLPGRLGYWQVGVPPSGPMDDLSFRLGNALVGNPPGTAGLECTATGPALRFTVATEVVVAGAAMTATLDEQPIEPWTVVAVAAGSLLDLGPIVGPGLRTYVLVRGGVDVPPYLGSLSTFALGGFGGHSGRALRVGDSVPVADPTTLDGSSRIGLRLSPTAVPELRTSWTLGVLHGPHVEPDFFTPDDIDALYGATWTVHFNSDRTGVRLIGPRPTWARADGGEAGLHPSNIHDTVYAVGTVDFTGDMPVVLGPDGPSLGGFVCPATLARDELWKLGQLRPGDEVRFVAIDAATAAARAAQTASGSLPRPLSPDDHRPEPAVLARLDPSAERPAVAYRRDGDHCVLVEYGDNVLDLELRARAHALMTHLQAEPIAGIEELAPGIRSVQVRFDPTRLGVDRLLGALVDAEAALPAADELEIPSRVVHLPLSFDDPATRLAIERYMASVRDDAPWTPSNLEFIRRVNGLDSIDDVHDIVFGAEYLVLGLGDVYLGAPVATPVDPRHRLVATKYNPARTWTAENSVGIGGAYLCVYGMEGPGGYQFVGRTLQMWNRWRTTEAFVPGSPWLLRLFDRIRFHPVSAEELVAIRDAFPIGRYQLRTEPGTFRLGDHRRFLADNEADIASVVGRRRRAFDQERARWEASGELRRAFDSGPATVAVSAEAPVPAGALGVTTPVHGSVWQVLVEEGATVSRGQTIVVVESMKMETAIESPVDGRVTELRCAVGREAPGGSVVAVVVPS